MWWLMAAALAGGRREKAAELAEQALDGGDPELALKLAGKAVRKDPTNALAHYALGLAYLRLQDRVSPELAPQVAAAAHAEFQRVTVLDPTGRIGALARDALAGEDAWVLPEPECPGEAAGAYREAEAALERGDRGAARAAYTRALEGCPENPVWWVHAGDAWFPEELPEALEHYDRGIALAPCHWQGLRFRADALVQLGRVAEAREALVRAVACNPTYRAGWSDAATVTELLGGTAKVRGPFELPATAPEAASRGPGWVAWWLHRERDHGRTLDDALAAARAGIAAAPPEGEWALLAELDAAGTLPEGVLILLYEPSLREDLRRATDTDLDALTAWVGASLFPPP